jgi:hypothetical protein
MQSESRCVIHVYFRDGAEIIELYDTLSDAVEAATRIRALPFVKAALLKLPSKREGSRLLWNLGICT